MTQVQSLESKLQDHVGEPWPEPQLAPDAVNLPMIRHFVEAVGDCNPAYVDENHPAARRRGGVVAPPGMLQAWIMPGIRRQGARADSRTPQDKVVELCVDGGYTAVVATDSEQDYRRQLRLGDRLQAEPVIESISPEKRTALGPGFFVTTRSSYKVGEELVAEMLFRILLYRPEPRHEAAATAPATPTAAQNGPAPVLTGDNTYFFEGLGRGELLIQRCAGCEQLRHPPQPRCALCGSYEWDTVRSAGKGRLHSFVVAHHPPMPGFEYPLPVGLVELDEGVRVVAPLSGLAAPPAIGQPLVAELRAGGEATSTYLRFRPATAYAPAEGSPSAGAPARPAAGDRLPDLAVPVTRTSIIAGAIATRDYQDVHHDPERARAKGSPDIFMNILTTNGYVGRYATDWGGPDAVIERIAIRLGAPNYPGDTMTLTGEVASVEPAGRVEVAVKGTNRLGSHVTGRVVLRLAGEGAQ